MIIDYGSNVLSQNYVYYERLRNDSDEGSILYKNANASMDRVSARIGKSTIAEVLLSMAAEELSKETAVLKKIFGVNISIDLYNKDSAKLIIDSFNSVLNLKAAYERNITRIKSGEKKIDIASFFPNYFNPIYNKSIPQIVNYALRQWESNPSIDIINILEDKLSKALPNIIEEALKRMFNSKTFNSSSSDEQRAYQELLDSFDKFSENSNWLKNQLYTLYDMDKIKQNLLDTVKNYTILSPEKRTAISMKKKKILPESGPSAASKAGNVREYVENYITNYLLGIKGKDFSIEGRSTHSGASQMKADNIISFNLPLDEIEEAINKIDGNNRAQNVDVIQELGNKLKNVTDGVIIYSNAKNYSLNTVLKKKGFSAGEDTSMRKLRELLNKIENSNADTFIGAILQTAEGAIGTSHFEELQDALAADIAYFLFDDFDTIGVPKSNLTALHIFDLNGIFIPLSFFLWILGEAVKDALSVPTDLLDINITVPKIKYPEPPNKRDYYIQEDWDEQRDFALDNTKVSINFLKSFANIIKQYL